MSNPIVKAIDAERKRLTTKLRALDKARALLEPTEEVPTIKRSSPRKKKAVRRKRRLSQSPAAKAARARRAAKPNSVDKGLTDTIINFLKSSVAAENSIGLKATDIVEQLGRRGFMFTSKFPSRSVSGLLTILHKQGRVTRTPKGNPRIYHYKAVVESKSRQRRLEHQRGGESSGLETPSPSPQ